MTTVIEPVRGRSDVADCCPTNLSVQTWIKVHLSGMGGRRGSRIQVRRPVVDREAQGFVAWPAAVHGHGAPTSNGQQGELDGCAVGEATQDAHW